MWLLGGRGSKEGCEAGEDLETRAKLTKVCGICAEWIVQSTLLRHRASRLGPWEEQAGGRWYYVGCPASLSTLCPAAVTWQNKAVMCGADGVWTSVTPVLCCSWAAITSLFHIAENSCTARQTTSCAISAAKYHRHTHWVLYSNFKQLIWMIFLNARK